LEGKKINKNYLRKTSLCYNDPCSLSSDLVSKRAGERDCEVWWLLCGQKEGFFGTIVKRLFLTKLVVVVSVWPLEAAGVTEAGYGG
jgi:hypothetical protein